MSALNTNCAGMRRRDFLQLGLGGVLGLGFCDLLRLQASAKEAGAVVKRPLRPGSNVNCILVWLDGGPSHYETFDPKSDAPLVVGDRALTTLRGLIRRFVQPGRLDRVDQ